MSKVQRASTLSGLIDSDVEDTMFGELPTPDSATEKKLPAKKTTRGRPKAVPSKVTKTRAPARRTSGRQTVETNDIGAAKGARKALADKTNHQYDGETEEVDDFDQDVLMGGAEIEHLPPVKQTKSKPAKKAPREKAAPQPSIGESQRAIQSDTRIAKKGKPARKEIPEELSPEKVIQETQFDPMDMDGDLDEEVEEIVTKTAHQSARQISNVRPHQPGLQRRRAGSASDTERGDPTLRRKLGEMTKKYENLQLKHQDLREIGLKEYERNYEKLRKQGEEKTKGKQALSSIFFPPNIF
jgi:hypothetical protein